MTTLSIPDMSCGHCRASIEAALRPLPGVTAILFDAAARQATIEGPASAALLMSTLDGIGFPATPVTKAAD
ncbi:heavy-metal-associated domain-containing protein [Gemmobacter fulvus]|uniref:Heavy-metal-associated domain-containing protein n=1 Tax=Gemmobacter fulvus TaxID=2840474 RepID=A0A975S1T1_9RHOB|nr:heavy-metal-associated domain-containing protein [Gemmobacter fulvus]MBT9245282.1 heavy-metal-associated domain-containing protein [Gemmobacter fulvus]QWK90395.1 heavy-metal-associated domain-containing protein [Gemmobacter fulvus]